MYKLAFIDLDGTLLNSNDEISKTNCEIIKKIKDDVKIVLSSARGFYRIKNYLEQLELLDSNNYTIAYNGNLTMDNFGKIIIDEKLKKEYIFKLLEFIKKDDLKKWSIYSFNQRINICDIENIDEFIENNDIYKINCKTTKEQIDKIYKEIPSDFYSMFEIVSSMPTHITFSKKGITKLEAVKKIANILNVEKEDIIAIGDGENDIEMIEYAGCGVAMKNGMEKVKQVADLITDTNDNHGVGKVLIGLVK